MKTESASKVRVRFAPSPTGPLHIGGARSALFNYIFARKHQGDFIVRIEDTDLERSSAESEKNILDALRWLGIEWNEGITVGGDYGPYRQTERLELYKQFTRRLLKEGKAYYCYCTEEELEAERQAQLARGENIPRYSGKCRDLTDEDCKRLEAEGRKPTVRFRVPQNQQVIIHDLVRGKVTFDTDNIGDYVIVKSDGIPVYNYACVIDDALMQISHVIRGEEHLSNTPRQLLIYEALDLPKPLYAHVSLILGKDRSKMSKRHGATSIEAYKQAGYLPEALVNFLMLLGWSPPGEEEILKLDEIVELFSLERVARNPAVFDMDKLRWINATYIRRTSIERLADLAIPHLQRANILGDKVTEEQYAWVKLLVEAVQDRLSYLGEIVDKARVFLEDTVVPENNDTQAVLEEEQVPMVLLAFKKEIICWQEKQASLDITQAKAILKNVTKKTKLKGKKVFMPLRVALTGQMHGAELYYIISLLGVEGCLRRIQQLGY